MTAPALRDLGRALRRSPLYRQLRDERGEVAGLPIPAAAWLASLVSEELDRPLLVLVPREADALRWLEAAELFGDGGSYFPAPSLTPYQWVESSLAVRAQESKAVDRIVAGGLRLLVTSPRALFRRLPVGSRWERGVLELRAGMGLPLEGLVEHLQLWGYRRTDLVGGVGEFAVRGGLVDLFPPDLDSGLRVDFFGDTVESIRSFETEDQRSRDTLEAVRVLPLALFRSGAQAARELADHLASGLDRHAGLKAAEAVRRLREGGDFEGWEALLPLTAGETAALPDLLDRPLLVALEPELLLEEAQRHSQELESDRERAREKGELAPPEEALEQPLERVESLLRGAELRLGQLWPEGHSAVIDFGGSETELLEGQLPRFPREVETARARGERLFVVVPKERHGRLHRLCETYHLELGPGGVELVDGQLERGFRLPAAGLVVFGERQLFGRAAPGRLARPSKLRPFLQGLRDLKVGDFVVHSDHGIGQFVGLRTVGPEEGVRVELPAELTPLSEPENPDRVEVMEVVYAGERSLLLPLSRLGELQRYSGLEGVSPRLDRLGGVSWSRTRERVKEGMRQMAGDLLKLYAERQLARAPAMPADSDLQAQFEAAFEYQETEDQLESAAAIKRDLEREQPMDRLLCGDVGFGKTEVAMRAAFKVVDGGFQVAVLAPTTILADQHFETFSRRFAGFPINVEMVSRFRSPAEIRAVQEKLKAGRVDILIGTHRLLSRDIELQKLGLLIIDEEQRFGVAQKERLRELKKNVHVLAMTATPVPRTLQLSLAGVRDLSIIETPPRDRMAVETVILPFGEEVVREAIQFELERGGQVYFVYNRVAGIEAMAHRLREVVPGLRLTIGHGQMEERELARRMHAFQAGEYDLLLATTIIENGIDISNVNTMLVNHAQRFGLAQLYQLRGRVGRSDQLAYCYLLVPPDRIASEEARKRLAAIREFSELGAGFRVAARDLEIRGAGNLLGAEQSGHIAAVGIDTYLKLLETTVRELKGEEPEELRSASVDLPVSTTIPADYIADTNLRLEVYRRAASGDERAEELLSELQDRFGQPPEQIDNLLYLAALKRLAESLGVQSISSRSGKFRVRLRRDARVDVDHLIRLVSETAGASFSPSGVLTLEGGEGSAALESLRTALEALAG